MSRIDELKAQIAQLDALIAEGTLSSDTAGETRRQLEQQLLALVVPPGSGSRSVGADAPGAAPVETGTTGATVATQANPGAGESIAASQAPQRPSRGLVAGVVGFVLAFGLAGYAWVGNRAGLSVGPGSVAAAASAPAGAEQIEVLLGRLEQRLKDQPNDAEGWAMLGRSYSLLGRFDDAVPAFRRVVALKPKEAQGYADLADALASAKGGTMEGEPTQLITQALQLEPKNLKGLALSGSIAFNRGDLPGAIRQWELALAEAQPEGDMARQLQSVIEETRKRMGSGDAAAGVAQVPPSGAAAPGQPATQGAGQGAAQAAAPAASASVQGRITLAAALQARAAPDDTLYVFARPSQGAKLPLAILRRQVKDLPLDFVLDDSQAMSPAARLSGATEVVIGARISKSGNPMPQPGDLQGLSAPVAVGTRGITLEIGEVLR